MLFLPLPYAIKEFKHRWYLMARDDKDKHIKSFALDRISNLEFTKKTFRYPSDFNPVEMYRDCFGIIGPNEETPHDIILSIEPFQGKYIKSLPLHESQEILEDNEGEFLIKLRLYLTHDFLMELLSFGETVEVVEPKILAVQVKDAHERALRLYES